MLARELALALAELDVAIVERRASQDLAGLRAGGLHSRTIEVLGQHGFPGWDSTASHLLAGVELAEEPEWDPRRDALEIHALSSMGNGVR